MIGARVPFDVICAGEAQWRLALDRGGLEPSGGAGRVALALAREGLRVGLATTLDEDVPAVRYQKQLQAGGVTVSTARSIRSRAVVLVDASGEASAAESQRKEAIAIPEDWAAKVMLLSGLSPFVAIAASLCRAARTARRSGATVMIDCNASLHEWAGRDARAIRMVLREVDVARCTFGDLAVLALDVAEVREILRPDAVLVTDEPTRTVARGPFGEVVYTPEISPRGKPRSGDLFMAALCASLLRRGEPGASAAARWQRSLATAHERSRGAIVQGAQKTLG